MNGAASPVPPPEPTPAEEEPPDPAAELPVAPLANEDDAPATEAEPADEPNWWHRDHPVFVPLSGFFTGLFTVVVVPGLLGVALRALFDYQTAQAVFPYVAVIFAVPFFLMIRARTRTFGRYMLMGMALTLIVVAATAALTLWVLISVTS